MTPVVKRLPPPATDALSRRAAGGATAPAGTGTRGPTASASTNATRNFRARIRMDNLRKTPKTADAEGRRPKSLQCHRTMASLDELARRHTALDTSAIGHLKRLVASWGLLADFCFADLLLFVPES